MKKYIYILLFGCLSIQSCSNRDGEIIEMIKAMQTQNEELKVQITTLQNSANAAMSTLNKISLVQAATDKKVDALQADLKSVLTQLSTIATQITAANANTAEIKAMLDTLQLKCVELIKQINVLNGNNNITTDIDGNIYNILNIGTQSWMQENLNVSKYKNGDIIPYVPSSEWSAIKYGAWCYYNNDQGNGIKYGKLYNWYAAIDPRGLAPQGWHISTNQDWNNLITLLNSTSVNVGSTLKSTTSEWQSPNVGATNFSGFTGLPGGLRTNNDGGAGFYKINQAGWWLVAGGLKPEFKGLFYENGALNPINSVNYWNYFDVNTGVSIRCVKD